MSVEGFTVEALSNHVKSIPTLPTVLTELSRRMEDPKTSSEDLAQVIQQDQAISSKVLKLVNSPFYGYSGRIHTINQGIVILGFNAVKNLVLSTSVMEAFKSTESGENFRMDQLWVHSAAVAGVAKLLAERAGVIDPEEAFVAGLLHDIGKVGIPDSILFKPGKLTGAEWETMRAHPVLGEEICRPVKSLGGVLPLIRHHHERWDGSGYPDGLRETDIPLLARVLQTVDIYDALTNPRPYKQAYSSVRALEILQEETDCGWRDKEITSLFIRTHKRMLTAMADSHIGGYCPAGISDSLRNLEALAMH